MSTLRIVNICQYIAHNPRHGGAIRVFNINNELAQSKDKDMRLVQFSYTPLLFMNQEYKSGNYAEIVSNPLAYTKMVVLLSRILGIESYDFILPFTFKFIIPSRRLVEEIKKADIIVIEHPWLFRFAYKLRNEYNKKAKLVLDCHNAEIQQYKDLLKNKFLKKSILKTVRRTEEFAVKQSDLCLSMCVEDANFLAKEYDVDKKKFIIVPTGVDLQNFKPLISVQKEKLKQKLGLAGKKIVLFSGAKHPPNYEAYLQIKNIIAPKIMKLNRNKDILFVIAGSICKKQSFENIVCTGKVDDILPYFQVVDIAINPMLSGSGFNGKMIEYFAVALPVITTQHGARGLAVKDKNEVLVRNIEDFPKTINNLLENTSLQLSLAKKAGGFVKDFEWKKIVSRLRKKLTQLI